MSQWPVVTTEEVDWVPGEAYEVVSQAQRRRHRGPYSAAVVPRIADQSLTLTGSTLASVEEAATEVARFDEQMGGEIAPFAALLLRSEAAASSQIENLTASARAIAEAEAGVRERANAALVVANTRAMTAALELAEDISTQSLLAMHDALLHTSAPAIAGRFREEAVWIGGTSIGPHLADYVAPAHARVPDAIQDLVSFIHRDDLPVLPQVAIAHAHFETIHPFADGNGRTGRALIHSMLRHKGLTTNVTVPVSAGLLADTRAYFHALDAYRDGDVETIVRRVAEATLESLTNGRALVRELREIRRSWRETLGVRDASQRWAVAELVLRQPVVTGQLVAESLAVAPSNVYRHLDALAAAGILVESTDQRRNRVWRSTEVLSALDAFAARVGRRYRETSA